jgi:hypothetical protein
MVLLNTTDRLTVIVQYSGMDINVETTKVIISRQPFPIPIMSAQKNTENVNYFICLGTMITNDARRTREIKYRIAMVKAAFNKKKTLYQQIKLNMEEAYKMLHLEHSFVLYCNLDTSDSESKIPLKF